MDIPRLEHPRPQFRRDTWLNLNGPWSYVFDFGCSGLERGLSGSLGLENRIIVPFCPESKLSGIGYTDFISTIWYHRTIEIPGEWRGKRVLLHFGGVDYECGAYIDGFLVGQHWGGSVSFSFDVSRFVSAGSRHHLVVRAVDDIRSGVQPGGKQNPEYIFHRNRCHYTRTTGIWSTVWLEAVDARGLISCRIIPDLDGGRLLLSPRFFSIGDCCLRVCALANGSVVGQNEQAAADGNVLVLELPDPHPWSPADPFLYDLELEVVDSSGRVVDQVASYAGLRKVHVQGDRILLNNQPIYLRFVLDQGFYPDGIWTAPSDEALKRDIELSLSAGFNGARLHQKVFEERFHYWADRLGYLTWGESPSWGVLPTDPVGARNLLSEWTEIVERDRDHPSIIAWTPLNETRQIQADPGHHYRFHQDLYNLTHMLDPTRPVNETSGYIHVCTDLWTVHIYCQDPVELLRLLTPDPKRGVYRRYPEWETEYEGQPYLVAEFGGIFWIPVDRQPYIASSWGYGERPESEEAFYQRLEGLVESILVQEHICGFCYTQLTDVEQEQNGIYNFDRSTKFDMNRIATIFSGPESNSR